MEEKKSMEQAVAAGVVAADYSAIIDATDLGQSRSVVRLNDRAAELSGARAAETFAGPCHPVDKDPGTHTQVIDLLWPGKIGSGIVKGLEHVDCRCARKKAGALQQHRAGNGMKRLVFVILLLALLAGGYYFRTIFFETPGGPRTTQRPAPAQTVSVSVATEQSTPIRGRCRP